MVFLGLLFKLNKILSDVKNGLANLFTKNKSMYLSELQCKEDKEEVVGNDLAIMYLR